MTNHSISDTEQESVMKDQNILFVIAMLTLLMSAPGASGSRIPAADSQAEGNIRIQIFELNRESTVLAENKSRAAESEGRSVNENEDQATDSETAGKKKSSIHSNDAETKPFKAFKPSEEIPADQAVDFPVDI